MVNLSAFLYLIKHKILHTCMTMYLIVTWNIPPEKENV